jgi:hypothetical protein
MPDIQKQNRRRHLVVLLAYAALTLVMTWPVVSRMTTHLAGGRDDLWVHQWNLWWIKKALLQGLNPFFTGYLYAPEGAALTSHNFAWFNIALWLPIQAIAGRNAAYNLVFLIVIALNGFCMYLFAWAVTRSRWGAFVAGLLFAFWPYTLSHYDHTNMMVLFWVPLTLYLLHQLLSDSTAWQSNGCWWLVLGTAFSLAMIGISRWQLLIMSSPILIAYVLYLLFTTGGISKKRTLLELLIVVGLAALVMAPLAAPFIIDQVTRDYPDDVFLDEPQWGRTDLLAYVLPSIHNGLWRNTVANLYENFTVNKFYTPYLGFISLLVAFIGIIRRWKKTWLWLLLALIYLLFALGPELAINGRSYPQIPMPYRLVEEFILLRLLRRPDRLNIFLSLPMAMLVAWGMEVLLSTISSQPRQRIIATGIILLVLIAYLPVPFATTEPQAPEWYSDVAENGEMYTVLDLPLNDRSYDKWYMQYQTVHEKPLATGHVSRLPRETFDFLNSVPLLKDLRQRDQLPDKALTDVTKQLNLLDQAGIRYLVIHKKFANEGLQAVWRDWLTVSPTYEDEQLIVYRTAPRYGQDFSFTYNLGEELGLIAASISPLEAVQSGTINVEVRWGTSARLTEAFDFCLLLLDEAGEALQTSCYSPDPFLPTDSWPANDVLRADYRLHVDDNLAAGPYDLAISLADAHTNTLSGETAVVGKVNVHPYSPSHHTTANWQDEIQLTGFDLHKDDKNLDLVLFWQAQQPVASSYKVFVHVVDSASGEIVAQSDAIPRNWGYKTNDWEAGEIVRDPISLSLDDAPPGSYELRVGLYDESSGQRLLINSEDSARTQEFLVLTSLEW